MTALGLGDIAAFPFVDPPDRRNISDGVQPAARARRARPGRGRPGEAAHPARPAAGPAAGRPAAGPDGPRGRPQRLRRARCWSSPPRCPSRTRASGRPTSRQQADQAHARFADAESDFLAYLNLWRYLREQQQELSASAFRRMCKRGVPATTCGSASGRTSYSQLRQVGQGRSASTPSDAARPRTAEQTHPHQSLLRRPALAHRAARTPRQAASTSGARGAQFAIFPGSALFKKPPRWVMAAELVETSRLWAPDRRADRAGVGRAAGRAPGQAHLQRAALGEEAGAR